MINVARDFSRFPAGRRIADGPNSGQRFREQLIVPALRNGGKLKIELDGTRGYGSSFLDEAFGGLVRELHMDPRDLVTRIDLVTDDPSLALEIKRYWVN